jgi:hypothetical protein
MDKCFICHNLRCDKPGPEYTDPGVHLEELPMEWTMHDGTAISIRIHKCRECMDKRKAIEEFGRKAAEKKLIEEEVKAVEKKAVAGMKLILPMLMWVAS